MPFQSPFQLDIQLRWHDGLRPTVGHRVVRFGCGEEGDDLRSVETIENGLSVDRREFFEGVLRKVGHSGNAIISRVTIVLRLIPKNYSGIIRRTYLSESPQEPFDISKLLIP